MQYECGAACTFVASGFATGLVGTIAVTLLTNAGGTQVTRATSGIIELPGSSGIYHGTVTIPATPATYTVRWDNGSLTPGNTAVEQIAAVTSPTAVLNVGTATYSYAGSEPATFTYSA